ncbi:amino acid ABC transporter ATP-binding protein [Convivina praedatoris]|uniref:Glutamine transport ATP-binding protein GlnQ n=1 Tax=Convivina praedatoris TaxID=2880963 RepID=A0ABM9D417_9LACO|nr:ATP-binding cassette domain-containing protein [Convivina sp. LMG 32447]CAH1854047.1 Glutamine transport ATP-binding protein GlnQ [Convivina sp. LMG 32447]CAH1855407.1 Glutamine transport ATP-binding protein GlnQ [Convivina sp. LMG 32447]
MLEIKGLTKKYGQNVIFKDLDLTLNNGEVLSVIGPSGIGKTTLIKIMTGLETANSGQVFIDGEEFGIGDGRLNAKIGIIFQDFNLFPNYTVLDNITLAPVNVNKLSKKAAKQEAIEFLDTLGMKDKEILYPYQLSGGQKQRVAIARALAMHPNIIAYDEPTSGLDEHSTRQVAAVIKQLKSSGVTQLVITHDQYFAELISDRIFDFAQEVQR